MHGNGNGGNDRGIEVWMHRCMETTRTVRHRCMETANDNGKRQQLDVFDKNICYNTMLWIKTY